MDNQGEPGRSTVCVQLLGGLGNQLFQAAAAFALAARTGSRLAFDTGRIERGGSRTYGLDGLAHGAEILSLSTKTGGTAASVVRAIRRGLLGRRGQVPSGWQGAVFQEAGYHFDGRFAALQSPVYLTGFFQSPRYFSGFESAIRSAFDPAGVAGASARDLADSIGSRPCISLHVRRGDYASDRKAIAAHGVLDDAYYDRAVALIRRIEPCADLYLFSDSPEHAHAMAGRWDASHVVAGFSALDDIFLMSRCRHHIIANSTFSWWGAYLRDCPGGQTIAPRQWFARPKQIETHTDDLFPAGWILT